MVVPQVLKAAAGGKAVSYKAPQLRNSLKMTVQGSDTVSVSEIIFLGKGADLESSWAERVFDELGCVMLSLYHAHMFTQVSLMWR